MQNSNIIIQTFSELETLLPIRHIQALIFDMDGVVTQTANVHAQAWKKMFDTYLLARGQREGKTYELLDIETDYPAYIDGIPRPDGVRNFLRSRHISLPEGLPADSPGTDTIHGLGNQKNVYFREVLQRQGVTVFDDAVTYIKQQQQAGRSTAIISASKNCTDILQATGLTGLFGVQVDGLHAAALNLKGKPEPDIFLEAARQLNVTPAQAAIFEDARAGVQAGKTGGFGLVIGVNRKDTTETEILLKMGADVVLELFKPDNMTDQQKATEITKSEAGHLPSALEKLPEWKQKFKGRKPAVFLDYDGCLTPIVKRPEDAILSSDMRNVLQQLAEVCPVAVVSGRDRANVANLVQLDNLYFAGSHGFDITGPNGLQTEPGGAAAALPALDEAEKILTQQLKEIEGAQVERKKYAIAVHYRNVAEANVAIVELAVDETLDKHKELKKGLGKKVFELKPNLDWHKGKAVLWLLQELNLDKPETLPIYIGDDITDEDAFASLQNRGLTILVGEHDEHTAAQYRLESVEEVKKFLKALRSLCIS